MLFANQKAQNWRKRLGNLFSKSQLSDEDLQRAEELLFEADFSYSHIEQILGALRDQKEPLTRESLKKQLHIFFESAQQEMPQWEAPEAIMVVGINGAGKTTFCARLAHYMKHQKGLNTVLGAADTFRAGAVEQLKIWAERIGIKCVESGMQADPASVAYKAWDLAKSEQAILILDTAGRMHTKQPLMEQLNKMVRVMQKDGSNAPQESWLVLDGSAGQNSVHQAKEFAKVCDLTGLVVTKMDGSARGGAALSASMELSLPLRFVGTGEGAEDLVPFELDAYIDALLSEP